MKLKKIVSNTVIILVIGITAGLTYNVINRLSHGNVTSQYVNHDWQANLPDKPDQGNLNFTYAAERTVHGVVHVKTIREREIRQIRDPFEFFFGPRERQEEPEPEVGFGSGVIITKDGYIVTNAHVIRGADEIEVTLNDQRSFSAEVQGKDPNTDLAILKIDETDLPYINFGSSDDLRIGEWVLAVGNPFGLTSTVTAGIISAKERTLGVIQEAEMPLESFLQTDAAVNVGNSGGALVNLRGELLGIPTLIISPTRTHIGTAFAIPSSIVKRVKEDIIEYGEVRRGVLGVTISEVTSELAAEKELEEISGVYVEGTVDGSAADKAGIRKGDVILEVNGNEVNSTGELQEQIHLNHPGDEIQLIIRRNGRSIDITAQLLGMEEHRELVMRQEESLLGATFRMVPEELKEELGLPGGVQVIEIGAGELQAVGMREGFIIVGVNKQLVSEPAHIRRLLEDFSGNVFIEGIYPDGTESVYAFSL